LKNPIAKNPIATILPIHLNRSEAIALLVFNGQCHFIGFQVRYDKGHLLARPFSENPSMSSQRPTPSVSVRDFQDLIHQMYYQKDLQRGIPGTFMWLMEEIGELASALQSGNDRENLEEEFADVLAWLATIANVAHVDLAQALQKKYGNGCPGCGLFVCTCAIDEKP
jgi:NTP pyrophosphatase (non-canonical NTP hydrolase)